VNAAHLFVGTPSDNMRDMLAKGRGPKTGAAPLMRLRGEMHPRWKGDAAKPHAIYHRRRRAAHAAAKLAQVSA
jgi:hypothetical protein